MLITKSLPTNALTNGQKENCEKLLDDLLSSYECYKESDYFCGSLVLIAISEDSKAKTYDIVDGQQRLSTFILLAKF